MTIAEKAPMAHGRTLAVARRVTGTVSGALATVVAASFVIYAGLSMAPGDPVARILGARATAEARATVRAQLGLDDPLLERYWRWLTAALQGDLGRSSTYRQEVAGLLGPRLQTTLILVALAATLVLVVGVAVGVAGGIGRRGRSAVAALVALGVAVPSFVAANALIGVFAVQLGWFPTYGAGDGFLDKVWHLALPAVALSIGYGAYVSQLTSAAVDEQADKEYVATSRGRGIPAGIILRKHVLRNAALPVLTASGLAIAGLVSGTLIVEQAFGVDGIGALLVQSISSKDYDVVTAVSLIIVVVFVAMTTMIDLVQVALDPRERAGA